MTYTKLVLMKIEYEDHHVTVIGKAPAFSHVLPGDKVKLYDGSVRDVASTIDIDENSEEYKFILSIYGCDDPNDPGEPVDIVGVFQYREFRGDCG